MAGALKIVTALMMAGAASAQNLAAQSGPNNNAINSDQKNSDKPVAGRNSFTEGQAKSKIQDAGYSSVGDLKKDENGVWRGKASKGGSSTNVSVDFQGNANSAKQGNTSWLLLFLVYTIGILRRSFRCCCDSQYLNGVSDLIAGKFI